MARIQNGNHVYDEETDQWFSFPTPGEATAYCEQGTHYVTPEVELRASETVGSALVTVGSSPVMLLAADPNREQVHISCLANPANSYTNNTITDTNPAQIVTGPGNLLSMMAINHGTTTCSLYLYNGTVGSNQVIQAIAIPPSGGIASISTGNGIIYTNGLYIDIPNNTGSVSVYTVVSSSPTYALIGDRPSIMSGIGYLIPSGKDMTIRSRAGLWAVSPTGTIQVSALTEYIQ